MDCDVLVIGGGYAGLSTGAILAHSGRKVLLLEKAKILGGRAHYLEKDGYTLEYGLHDNRYAGQGPAAEVFRKIGKNLDFIEPGEPMLFREGRMMPLPNGVPKIIKSKDIATPAKLHSALAMIKLVAGKPDKLFKKPVQDLVSAKTPAETVMLLQVLSGIGIIAPDLKNSSQGEFGAFLKAALKAKVTVGYPRGGTRQIIDTLAAAIRANGEIRTGVNVESIGVEGGKIGTVQADGESFRAKVVVSAIPVQGLPDLFGDSVLPPAFAKYARSLEPTAGISLDFGLSRKVSDESGLYVSAEPLTMGQFTSNLDPGMAPAGKQLGNWYYPLPAAVISDEARMKKETQVFKDLLARMFPGIWDALEWERVLYMPMVDGFLPKPGQTRLERPDFKIPGVGGFYLAGDTTRAHGTGGDTAFNSALQVSELVMAQVG
ncbi:MAG: phytoene desaturase family protein [Candidatus Geothermincolia bacterium]